jgi:benzoyl-CoA reductase/2-hydroxyglutaryl-CoA dehydratase subunit BcrC/BadD/HgdB
MDKNVPKIMLPIKPPEISYMTHEENEYIHNQLSKLEEQLNELSVRSIKSNDLVNTQRQIKHMENKMNKIGIMKKKMDENMVIDGKIIE